MANRIERIDLWRVNVSRGSEPSVADETASRQTTGYPADMNQATPGVP
jgi:hypothetical protein